MTDHDYDQQQWGECPPGELHALAGRLEALHRRQRAVKIFQFSAVGLLLVAAGVVTGGLINARRAPVVVARINCRECVAHFEAYHLYLIHEQPMDGTLAEQMQVHLARCARCRNAFEKQYPGVLIAIATDAAGLLVGVQRWPAGTAAAVLAGVCAP